MASSCRTVKIMWVDELWTYGILTDISVNTIMPTRTSQRREFREKFFIEIWFWCVHRLQKGILYEGFLRYQLLCQSNRPDIKVHGANMGPPWVLSAPQGPHVGPMNLGIRALYIFLYRARGYKLCRVQYILGHHFYAGDYRAYLSRACLCTFRYFWCESHRLKNSFEGYILRWNGSSSKDVA